MDRRWLIRSARSCFFNSLVTLKTPGLVMDRCSANASMPRGPGHVPTAHHKSVRSPTRRAASSMLFIGWVVAGVDPDPSRRAQSAGQRLTPQGLRAFPHRAQVAVAERLGAHGAQEGLCVCAKLRKEKVAVSACQNASSLRSTAEVRQEIGCLALAPHGAGRGEVDGHAARCHGRLGTFPLGRRGGHARRVDAPRA